MILLSLSFFLFPLVKGFASCLKRDPLFTIERNENKNVVQYDACLLPDDNVSDSKPVDVYWILSNGEEEKLSALENKLAYGIGSEEKLGKNRFRIFLAGLRNRSIIVEKMDGDYRALTQINGESSVLEKIYVNSKKPIFGLPKVNYIDLFGRSLQTNRSIQERITPVG